MPSAAVKRTHIIDDQNGNESNIVGGNPKARSKLLKSLEYSGSLDSFKHHDITPVVGREFEGLQVTDLLKWGDELIRDLAVTSQSALLPCNYVR